MSSNGKGPLLPELYVRAGLSQEEIAVVMQGVRARTHVVSEGAAPVAELDLPALDASASRWRAMSRDLFKEMFVRLEDRPIDEVVALAVKSYADAARAAGSSGKIRPRVMVSTDHFEDMRSPFQKGGHWWVRVKGCDARLARPTREAGFIVFDLDYGPFPPNDAGVEGGRG